MAEWVPLLLLFLIVALAAAEDLIRYRISNRLILFGLIGALVCRILTGGVRAILPCLCNIAFPVIICYLFYLAGILGAGDIKLFSVIGGFVNFKELLWCMAASFVIGALLALMRMLSGRSFLRLMKRAAGYFSDLLRGNLHAYRQPEGRKEDLMHFSVAILLGIVVTESAAVLG